MRRSIIFEVSLRILVPLLFLLSIVVTWRGHQLPGGGFIGGLIASVAVALRALASGDFARAKLLGIRPRGLILLGLWLAASSAMVAPLFLGQPFMTGIWFTLPLLGEIGTPVFFDLGVFFVVVGTVNSILLPLFEEEVA